MKPTKPGNKSQITIFILIGFIILVVAGMLVWLHPKIKVPGADSDKSMLQNTIIGCLEMKSAEWFMIHGMYSAQYHKNQNTFGLNNNIIAIPSVADTEAKLENFLDKQLVVCAADFNTHGFKIDTSKAKFEIHFTDRLVDVKYFNLLTATRGDKSITLSDGRFSINKRVKLAMTNSKDIFQKRRDDLYIRDDANLNQSHRIIKVIRDTENTENWLIIDNKNSEPYYFSFLVRLLL